MSDKTRNILIRTAIFLAVIILLGVAKSFFPNINLVLTVGQAAIFIYLCIRPIPRKYDSSPIVLSGPFFNPNAFRDLVKIKIPFSKKKKNMNNQYIEEEIQESNEEVDTDSDIK